MGCSSSSTRCELLIAENSRLLVENTRLLAEKHATEILAEKQLAAAEAQAAAVLRVEKQALSGRVSLTLLTTAPPPRSTRLARPRPLPIFGAQPPFAVHGSRSAANRAAPSAGGRTAAVKLLEACSLWQCIG